MVKAQPIRATTVAPARTAPAARRRLYVTPAVAVAGAYLLTGAAWILTSDWILGRFIAEDRATELQLIKGLGFVLVTSIALYLVLGKMMRDLQNGARTQASLASRLREQSRQQRLLSQRLLLAEEDTRRAVAKDLHDGPLQSLTLSFMRLDAATRPSTADEPPVVDAEQVAAAMAAIREASEEIRAVVRQLHPPLLAEMGLAAALERHCHERSSRTGRTVEMQLEADPEVRVEPDIGIAVFRVTQEAVANALKHTLADPITVRLAVTRAAVKAEIVDRGPGFNPDEQVGMGLGLLSMRERTDAVGGSLTIRSTANGGTHVAVSVPLGVASAS